MGKEHLHGEAFELSPEGRRKLYNHLEDRTEGTGGPASVKMGDRRMVGKFKVMQNWCG